MGQGGHRGVDGGKQPHGGDIPGLTGSTRKHKHIYTQTQAPFEKTVITALC